MKLQTPPKPKIIERISQFFGGLEETPRKMLLGGLILFFLLAASTTMLLAYYIYQPQITAFLQKSNSSKNPTQVSQVIQPVQINLLTPTPSCTGASLKLNASAWQLVSIQRNADGSITVPSDRPGVAYWISDLEMNNVFAVSPTPDNLSLLSALHGGEIATITWENCNTATFTLSAPQAGTPGTGILSDQTSIGIIVYIPETASVSGVMVQGGLAGEIITSPPTAETASSEVDAEISLLETSTSTDKQTIQVVISIMNYGATLITLTEGDISLTPEGAAPLTFLRADPSLPQKIDTGQTKTFTLIFPRPDTATATLKIFTIEYDLEDY